MPGENARDSYSSGGMLFSSPDGTMHVMRGNQGEDVGSATDGFFAQYIDKVQDRVETLYQDAQQFPASHSQQLVVTLQELRLAVEELHVAEEELLTQNEQLVGAQQLAEAERQRYQDLFDFAPDGYIVTDPNGIVREANRAAADLLNIERKYLVGKPLATYVPEAERIAFRTLLNQLQSAQRIQGWELNLQGRRTHSTVTTVTVEVIQNDSAHATGLRWLLRDISDLKQAEAILSQLQAQNLELLEVDRLRTQFLATVSHELKTPMNAILGFSQMLMKQFHCQQDLRTITMVERIFQNGQHLLTLIEDMLHFSRLRANQVALRPETFDLIKLINLTLDELRPLAEQKGLSLESYLPEVPLLVVNDRGRMRQVLTNLLSNAIKFTDYGRVVVSLQVLANERLLLQVRDTGCGISSQDQRHIFQEFWQVHSARHQSQGTGLGLAIVQALVQAMEGQISVESELGQGSIFRIQLPHNVTPREEVG